MRALLIPVEGPCEEIDLLPDEAQDAAPGGRLLQLQLLVGGYIEALVCPDFIRDADLATMYANEEGKLHQLPINRRATDFLVPGVGLAWGDYVAGPVVLAGFDPETGETRDLPEPVARRARLIEAEAR